MSGGGGPWLAQSVECVTLDVGVMSSSPTMGMETIFVVVKVKKKNPRCQEEEVFFGKTYTVDCGTT